MRILVLSNKCPPDYDGGYELSAFQVACALRDRGYDVQLLTSHYRSSYTGARDTDPLWVHRVFDYKEWPNLTHHGISRFIEDANRLADFTKIGAKNATKLSHWLQDTSVDLCYCFGLHGIGLATANPLAKRKLPILWHAGNYLIAQDLQLRKLWDKKRLAHRIGMHVLSGAAKSMVFAGDYSHIAFLSEAMKKEFARMGYEPEHGYVIPRGIDFPLADNLHKQRPRTFLMASRIGPEKGYDVVLDACGILAEHLKEAWELQIAGSGDSEYIARLKEKAKKLGIGERVHFLGMLTREDVLDRMRNAYAFISASLWEEPFGRTNIESLACGAALIAADTGAIREIVGSPECAKIYPKQDARALAMFMKELLSDPAARTQLARRGIDRIKENYTLDSILDLTENVFEIVMKDYGKPFQRPDQASAHK